MNRTYNVFVDNGLYIAAHYLNKEIKDLIVNDIIDNLDLFADKVSDFIRKNPKIAWMGFTNSSYTTALKYDMDQCESYIKAQYEVLMNNIGHDEHCCICGEKNVMLKADKDYISMLGRNLMPMLPANTFFNYSNNLQLINVCPVCILLCMISILNMTKAGMLVIYNSDSEEFMKAYTKERQENNLTERDKNKSTTDFIVEEIEWFIKQDMLYNGYIEAILFNNSGQAVSYDSGFVTQNELNMLKKMINLKIYDEFKELHLYRPMLNNKLPFVYQDFMIDFKQEKPRCSEELFNFVDEEVSLLNKNLLELIKTTCLKLNQANFKDCIKQLKETLDSNKFEDLILKWQEEYKQQTGNDLFNSLEEFNNLCNSKLYNQIKKRMISQFIILQ